MRAALGVQGTTEEVKWQLYLDGLGTQEEKRKYESCASRRKRICTHIVEQVYRNHVVKNAFLDWNFWTKKQEFLGTRVLMSCIVWKKVS